MELIVRTQKETNRVMRTHFLETAEVVRTGKKPTERGTLTLLTRWRGALVRTQKESDRPIRTHQLEMAE